MSTSSIPKLAVEVQPLGDRVVIVPVEAEKVTASGIIIPDTVEGEKTKQGIVIALGEGGTTTKEGTTSDPRKFLKIGDKVVFGDTYGTDVKLKTKDGKDIEVQILRLDSIFGIIK